MSNATPGTNANTGTLASIPAGLVLLAKVASVVAAGNIAYISSITESDQVPSQSGAPLFNVGIAGGTSQDGQVLDVWTNTSAQIRYRAGGNVQIYLQSNGWMDQRGQNA